MATEKIGKVYLKNVRLSFPALDEPKASVKDGPKKFRANFLMDPNTPEGKKNVAACQKAAREVIDEAWPKAGGKFPGEDHRKSLKKGEAFKNKESGEVYVGYEGMIAVSTAAEDQPLLMYRDKKRVPQEHIKRTFYGGCYVEAIIRFYAVTGKDKGGAGLFCSLEGVRFWQDGEPFGGVGADEDDFDDYEDDDFGDEAESGGEGDDDLL